MLYIVCGYFWSDIT